MPWPSVGVVVPTRNRPLLLRRAVEAIRNQEYRGRIRTVVVHDGTAPDRSVVRDGERPVAVLGNSRTPGLAGARNTGILALDTDLVAFCDDDDIWLPGKLATQVTTLGARPDAEVATCAIEVEFTGRVVPRLAGTDTIWLDRLLRSRMAMLHSSTFLVRRATLDTGVGLVAEDAPGSHNEDWDLLLRAAKRRPIVHVDEPLVRVLWGGTSLFAHQYDTKIESLSWMLERHPEIRQCRPGAARVYGQLACWHAAKGERRRATRWAGRALRARWREPRAAIALAAVAGVVSVETVLATLHRRGHGI